MKSQLIRICSITGAAGLSGGLVFLMLVASRPIAIWNEFNVAGAVIMITIVAFPAAMLAALVCDQHEERV